MQVDHSEQHSAPGAPREVAQQRWWQHLLAPAPWLVLIIAAAFTVAAAITNYRMTHEQKLQRFAGRADELAATVEHRLATYRTILRGFYGFIKIHGEVDWQAWRTYFETLAINEHFPGVQGVGFARLVEAGEREAFVAQVRAAGFDGFIVSPASKLDLLGPVEVLEPFD